jgi:hypothetical protein
LSRKRKPIVIMTKWKQERFVCWENDQYPVRPKNPASNSLKNVSL